METNASLHAAVVPVEGPPVTLSAEARAYTVRALLDMLDDLVTVARFFGDEMENDQTKVAMSEEAAKSGPAAMTTPSVAERSIIVAVFAPLGLLPGRRGQTARRAALEKGIVVEDDVIAAIRAL